VRRPAVRRRHGEPVCPAIGASNAIARPPEAPRRRRPLVSPVLVSVVFFISVLFYSSVVFISIQPRSFIQPHVVAVLRLAAGLQPGGRYL
jgi:hypothetical protein